MLILGFPTMVSGQWKVNKTVDDKYTINTQLNLLNSCISNGSNSYIHLEVPYPCNSVGQKV